MLELTEYEKEGISWDKVDFADNAECIDLFEVGIYPFHLPINFV